MAKMQYQGDMDSYPTDGETRQLDIKKIAILLVGLGLAIVLISYLIINSGGSSGESEAKKICGDNICDAGENCVSCMADCACPEDDVCDEKSRACVAITMVDGCTGDKNCWDDPADCSCADEEYCAEESKTCVEPTCGNGVCEIYESKENCCLDCECFYPGTFCNKETKMCETYEMEISDEDALSVAKDYLEDNGYDATDARVGPVSAYGEELIKVVTIPISRTTISVGVTEDGEVIELPIK